MSRSRPSELEIVAPDTPLSKCSEVRLGLALPFPISDRIDDLVASAEDIGERTNRKEVIAALVLSASLDGTVIANAIRELRKARAKDALAGNQRGAKEIIQRPRNPGPRPRL